MPSAIKLEDLEFDDRKVPEVYLYYLRYKKLDKSQKVEDWLTWFRSDIARLKDQITDHGEGILLEEAKELVKPLAEFS
jgi:hypothetical protein